MHGIGARLVRAAAALSAGVNPAQSAQFNALVYVLAGRGSAGAVQRPLHRGQLAVFGAGDTITPTIINVFCFWLWELPVAYGLAHMAGLGPPGVFWSIAVAYSTMALVSAAWFRRGRWKLQRV